MKLVKFTKLEFIVLQSNISYHFDFFIDTSINSPCDKFICSLTSAGIVIFPSLRTLAEKSNLDDIIY